jgi:hypothetical protein
MRSSIPTNASLHRCVVHMPRPVMPPHLACKPEVHQLDLATLGHNHRVDRQAPVHAHVSRQVQGNSACWIQ